jgi:hypothetical protein
MASTAARLRSVPARVGDRAAAVPTIRPVGARRHFAWLLGGMAGAFLIPFSLADRLELQRDVYYALYVAFATGLFLAWARDTGQSVRAILSRRWRLAVVLGFVFAVVGAVLVTKAEDGASHPGGVEFIGALIWRGLIYGAADGLLLSAFPILVVFAALKNSRPRRRAGGLIAVGAVAMVASLAMTVVYHAGYSDFRGSKLRRPVSATEQLSIVVDRA